MNKSKIMKICSISVIIIVGAGLGLYKHNKVKTYNILVYNANKYMYYGEYDKAIGLFEECLNYKKDNNIERELTLARDLKNIKIIYDNGIKLMNNKKYLEAIKQFNKITNENSKIYSDAHKKIDECKKQLIIHKSITKQQAMDLVKSKVQLKLDETLCFPYEESQAIENYNGAQCYVICKDVGTGEAECEICEYLVNIHTGAITQCTQGIYIPIN